MAIRRKRSHFMKLYLLIKDYIYYHIYFQYQFYWCWLVVAFCINFVVWDIFDILRLEAVYEYKIYIWKRCLIHESIFITDDVLINIMNKHKLLYGFYYNFDYCVLNNINVIFFLQIFKKIYMFKQVLLLNSADDYLWALDVLFTLSL